MALTGSKQTSTPTFRAWKPPQKISSRKLPCPWMHACSHVNSIILQIEEPFHLYSEIMQCRLPLQTWFFPAPHPLAFFFISSRFPSLFLSISTDLFGLSGATGCTLSGGGGERDSCQARGSVGSGGGAVLVVDNRLRLTLLSPASSERAHLGPNYPPSPIHQPHLHLGLRHGPLWSMLSIWALEGNDNKWKKGGGIVGRGGGGRMDRKKEQRERHWRVADRERERWETKRWKWHCEKLEGSVSGGYR